MNGKMVNPSLNVSPIWSRYVGIFDFLYTDSFIPE